LAEHGAEQQLPEEAMVALEETAMATAAMVVVVVALVDMTATVERAVKQEQHQD
jgi:hypothetical protein